MTNAEIEQALCTPKRIGCLANSVIKGIKEAPYTNSSMVGKSYAIELINIYFKEYLKGDKS